MGLDGVLLRHEVKALLDPQGLLNPGVSLNDDPRAHLQNLKPLPPADPRVDQCTECGFCEPVCPSAGLTLTPRQRIVGWRESARRNTAGEDAAELNALYDDAGIDTCAACGLCATACPVGIEIGLRIEALCGRKIGPTGQRVGRFVGAHFGATTTPVKLGLGAADCAHATQGTQALGALNGTLRKVSGDRIPGWSPASPRPARLDRAAPATHTDTVVYFRSCAARTMPPARGDPMHKPLPTVTARLLDEAGSLCATQRRWTLCASASPSKARACPKPPIPDTHSAELEAALRAASEDGRLQIERSNETIALHTVCTVRSRA
jgi:D-lactate dehydrogenase